MNRKFLSTGMVVTLILTIMSLGGCKDDDNTVTTSDPMSGIPQVKSLTSPENDYVVDLGTAGPLTFSWPAASGADNSYEIFFFEPGDFANPIIEFQADGDGAETRATLSRSALAKIVKAAGVSNGNSVPLQWGVYTFQSNSRTKVVSKEFRTITIEGTYRDPALTSLTPNTLTWDATSTEEKSIEIAGENLDGATITLSELTAFEANIEGSTITVTPKAANTTNADIVETLTVSVEGGSSLPATLTHKKAEVPQPAGSWVKVTTNKTDWSGTYLVVTDFGDVNRVWNLSDANNNFSFVTVDQNNAITAAGTTQGGDDISLESLDGYTVTIAKVEGGYTIQMKNGNYITNTSGAAGIVTQQESVIGANTISLNDDKNVEIHLDNSTGFGFFPKNKRFRYFPDNKWDVPDVDEPEKKVHISLYEINNRSFALAE